MVDRTVGQVAALVGVSVRTLHHWDELGLVTPRARSGAGYRLYSEADVERLHQVLIYRETGMSLSEIRQVLDDTAIGAREHLERQRRLLDDRIAHLQEKVSAVDRLLRSSMSEWMSAEVRAEILGPNWNPAWEEEAEERWGGTDAWQQSTERARRMSRDDWETAKAETEALEDALARAFTTSVEPGSDEANALAERHRQWLSSWADTSRSRQVLLARMYTEDPRFQAHYDDRAPGLATWLRSIVEANARAAGIDPDQARWE